MMCAGRVEQVRRVDGHTDHVDASAFEHAHDALSDQRLVLTDDDA
jgi:hypothetical protein